MGMHGPQVLVCGGDSSFRALIFIMKSVMGERGHFCQVLLICAFPMALNTKHSFGALEFGLCIETGHYGSVWRPSSILSRCHMGHDIVNSTIDVRIHVITSNIELSNLFARDCRDSFTGQTLHNEFSNRPASYSTKG